MLSKAVLCSMFAALATLSTAAQPAAKGPAAAGPKATLVAVEELKWVDVPNTPVKMATVKGNSTKGPHAAFMRLPGGFSAPLHSHSADHQVVVVAGTLTLTPEGGTAKKLGPGSWFEFRGKKQHVTTCEAGAECVLFSVARAAWDLVPADTASK